MLRLTAALVGTLTASVATAGGDFRFDGPRALELGYAPVAAQFVDLDGDGDLDLVVVNTGWFTDGGWIGSSAEVFLNPGDGYFETSTVFPVPNSPKELAVCDVDDDGVPDAVTPNTAADNLSVLLGDGQGGLETGPVIPVGTDPVDVFCLDLDGDGHPDLASADRFGFGVSVTRNAGDGTFEPPEFYPLGDLVNGVEGGDLDGDGDRDLMAFANGNTFIFTNDGFGNFSQFASMVPAKGWSRLCLIDDDEHLDLVAGDKVWFGVGDGTFDTQSGVTGLAASRVSCCDFDEDGDLDVVTGTGIAVSNGDGSFAGVTNLPPARDVGAVTCGNFMEDASVDLVRLHGTKSGTLGMPTGFASLIPGHDVADPRTLPRYPAGDSVWTMSAGLVDQDGHLDLVVGNVGTGSTYDNGSISVLGGNGDGTFGPFVSYPAGDRVRSLALADVDGDIAPDAVVGNYDDAVVSVLSNDGTGVFDSGTTHPALAKPEAIVVGDFDGWNGADIAAGNHVDPGTVAVLLGDGAGNYAPPTGYVLRGYRVIDLAMAQLNEDEHPDLAALCLGYPDADVPWPHSGLTVLFGNGDGTFRATPLLSTTAYNPRALDVCDVDNDSDMDLLVFTSGRIGETSLMEATLEVFAGDGAGSFAAPIVASFTSHGFDMKCGDIDGDGRADAVFPHLESSVVIVLPGNGDGTFGAPSHFETGPGAWALDLGDFNGDGELDLAVAHEESNDVALLVNRCASPFTVTLGPGKSNVAWTPACAADSYNVYRGALSDLVDGNGDGLPDAGYGTCVNDMDDSPGTVFDRIFSDDTVPTASGGFFYLVGFVGPAGEDGLGETSSGLRRFVVTPCP